METNKLPAISKVQLQSSFFKVVYQEYDQLIKARNLATKGQGAYQLAVKEFFYWLELQGIYKLKRITSALMVAYYEYLLTRPNKRKSGTLGQSTINQHLFSLRMLVDYLLETGQLKSAVVIPKNNFGSKKERNSITNDEAKLLYACCQTKLEKALLSTVFGCGLRRAEAEDLNVNDISFSSGILVVCEGKNKKRRDIPMNDTVIKDLRDYLINERSTYLKEHNQLEKAFFVNNKGKRMDGDHMNQTVKEIVNRTSNPTLMQKDISLHSLRHSVAEQMAENGADLEFIRDFLGHSEIDTSFIYARKNKQKQQIIKRQYEAANY